MSSSSVPASAAQIATVMKNASGRSGRASLPIEKYPNVVATIADAMIAVRASNQRRPAARTTIDRPTPESAAHSRACVSPIPATV